MADEIQVNYDEMTQLANRFASQAQAISDMQRQVQMSFAKLKDGGWKGTAADAFFAEMESLIFPAEARLQQALEEAGQAARNVAQKVQQAEQEASRLFGTA